MPKCILSGQVKSTFTQEQADGRYIQMTNGATTTLASSLQVSGINNIEFTEEEEESITASNVSYSNTTSGMTSENVQNAIDELFQSVSEGKSLIAAAVTDKGVETAATDSFATMAGNIGQISGGGGSGSVFSKVASCGEMYNAVMENGKNGLAVFHTDEFEAQSFAIPFSRGFNFPSAAIDVTLSDGSGIELSLYAGADYDAISIIDSIFGTLYAEVTSNGENLKPGVTVDYYVY